MPQQKNEKEDYPKSVVVWLGVMSKSVHKAQKLSRDKTISSWVRTACNERLGLQKKSVRHKIIINETEWVLMREELTRLRADLGRVGGNLNQLAAAFSVYYEIDGSELGRNHAELQKQFTAISEQVKKVKAAIDV